MNKTNLSFELKNGFPIVRTESRELGVLAMFLSIWNNSEEIKNELIPYIDERLEKGIDKIIDEQGNIHIITFDAAPLVEALIDKELTVITNWNDSNDKYELNTREFKKIIQKWLNFLESQGR